jgi:predicted DNA-binding protein (UPF0251 family)
MCPKLKLREIDENLKKILAYSPNEKKSTIKSAIQITLEEYEAIRLYYYDYKDEVNKQQLSAEKLNVSQPTFSRILKKGMEKLILAIVEGKPFTFSGGMNILQKSWVGWGCWDCIHEWQNPDPPIICPKCQGSNVFRLKKLEGIWE